jgi:hypothetical protein
MINVNGNEAEVNLDAPQLTARLETLIGHALHGQRARWRGGGVTLSDSAVRDDYVHVTANLEGSQKLTPWGGTVWVDVDVDFDLFLAVRQRNVGDDVTLNVDPRNIDTSFSPLLTWAGRIFDLLPCGPIASTVTGDGIPGCFAAIERAMDRGVQAGLSGVGVNATIPGSPQCCESLELVIGHDGAVTLVLGLVAEEDDPPTASSDLPAGTVVDKAKAQVSSEPVPGGGRLSPTRPESVEPILPGRVDHGKLNPGGRVDQGAKIRSR